jgi:hypothetical protein
VAMAAAAPASAAPAPAVAAPLAPPPGWGAPGKRALPPVPRPAAAAAPPAPLPPQHTVAIDPPPAMPTRDTVAVDPPPAAPTRDTFAVDPPAPTPVQDTGGIGGLFAGAEADVQIPPAPVPPPVAPRGAPPAAAAAAPVVPPMPPLALPKTGRLPAVTAGSEPPPVHGTSDDEWHEDGESSWGGRRRLLIALGAVALVVLAVVVGLTLLSGGGDKTADPGPTDADSPAEQPPAGPQPGDSVDLEGRTYTAQAVDLVDTCHDHAYGRVAEFLAATDCAGLSRALWATQLDGRRVVVSVSRVRMPDSATARELQSMTDESGTGNVNDLLREGKRYSGGPEGLSDAEYASAVSGPVVTIVESSWVDAGAGDAAEVDAVASSALQLESPPFPSQ